MDQKNNKNVLYRRFAQINDLKKLNANVAQKIAYRESKKSNSRIWGKQLTTSFTLFFRAMCTYSQIPNEAGSGGKTFGALWIFICHYYVVKKVKCDSLNWMPYLSRSTLFDVPIICRNVTFYRILVEKQSHIIFSYHKVL